MKKTIYDPGYRRLVGRLKAQRLAAGLDQATVAAKLGHTNRWLSKVEHRDIRLDVCQYARLCQVLGLDAGRHIRRLAEEDSEEDPPLFPGTGR